MRFAAWASGARCGTAREVREMSAVCLKGLADTQARLVREQLGGAEAQTEARPLSLCLR